MRHVIFYCDKCGKHLENFETINKEVKDESN